MRPVFLWWDLYTQLFGELVCPAYIATVQPDLRNGDRRLLADVRFDARKHFIHPTWVLHHIMVGLHNSRIVQILFGAWAVRAVLFAKHLIAVNFETVGRNVHDFLC